MLQKCHESASTRCQFGTATVVFISAVCRDYSLVSENTLRWWHSRYVLHPAGALHCQKPAVKLCKSQILYSMWQNPIGCSLFNLQQNNEEIWLKNRILSVTKCPFVINAMSFATSLITQNMRQLSGQHSRATHLPAQDPGWETRQYTADAVYLFTSM